MFKKQLLSIVFSFSIFFTFLSYALGNNGPYDEQRYGGSGNGLVDVDVTKHGFAGKHVGVRVP